MRKFALASVALFASVGLLLAAEVEFVKFNKEKKELTVKEKDEEKTYKVTDDTKFFRAGKGEKKEVDKEKAMETLDKLNDAKRKPKMVIKAEKDKLTEVEFKGVGKKKDKN
jgi:acyl-ACP thioesterase